MSERESAAVVVKKLRKMREDLLASSLKQILGNGRDARRVARMLFNLHKDLDALCDALGDMGEALREKVEKK